MESQEIMINVGISGSGKTTFTKEFLKNNPNYIRVNRDDIRKVLVENLEGYYQRSDLQQVEEIVTGIENTIAWKSIMRGFSLIIDNTNLNKDYINRWIKFAEDCVPSLNKEIHFRFNLFDMDIDMAKARVVYREFDVDNSLETKYELLLDKVKYIDRQANQYQSIKPYIVDNFIHKIIGQNIDKLNKLN